MERRTLIGYIRVYLRLQLGVNGALKRIKAFAIDRRVTEILERAGV